MDYLRASAYSRDWITERWGYCWIKLEHFSWQTYHIIRPWLATRCWMNPWTIVNIVTTNYSQDSSRTQEEVWLWWREDFDKSLGNYYSKRRKPVRWLSLLDMGVFQNSGAPLEHYRLLTAMLSRSVMSWWIHGIFLQVKIDMQPVMPMSS